MQTKASSMPTLEVSGILSAGILHAQEANIKIEGVYQ